MTEIIGGPRRVATAFLVVLTENGWEATADLDLPIKPDRQATVPEMRYGCTEVADDILASKISSMVIQQSMAMSRQMAQQAEAQSIRDRLKI